MSMAERIKMMSSGPRMPMPGRPNDPFKRHSAVENNIKFNPEAVLKKEEKPNQDKTKVRKEEDKSASFKDNFNNMKKMLENKGMRMIGAPRPSAQIMGMPRFDNFRQNNNTQNLEIIEEKSDKMASGYNPVDDLEKKLENVVIKKDKKKKKKPTFEG